MVALTGTVTGVAGTTNIICQKDTTNASGLKYPNDCYEMAMIFGGMIEKLVAHRNTQVEATGGLTSTTNKYY